MTDSAVARFQRLDSQPFSAPLGKVGITGTWGSLKAVFDHRQLLSLLVRRDIKARYKDSALGVLWTLINPIVQLAVYYVVMGQILGAARGIDNFAIYVFSGLTIFGLLSESLTGTTASIIANAGLVKKVYVPREVFPLAAMGSALFTFTVQVLVLVVGCFILESPPWTPGLLYFFPSVALIVLYGAAFGILFSAINVYLRDVQYLVQILLTLSIWASPIVYGWTMVADVFKRFNLPSWLLEVYTNNPLTLAVLGFHRAFWTSGTVADYPPELGLRMLAALVVGLIVLWICQRVFARLQGNFAQEL
ncbi:ABC transporter permease [Microbacterium sp. VKM Ac-2870]|uniref:ABC transporter permease n=1 Tax=Microbacterium sp. VKM Ac-2870 TaxID=2783825 RepID=UPI00188AAC88|nr:ABC transporter permease [Microbacterium sp. VKM Ac-2870]MBF4561685.1 ABC transporter permease [Microbacterium sp. VKM Ac-2870]